MKFKKFFIVLFTALFILTAAVALVVLFRPFYYAQYKVIKEAEHTDYTKEEMKQAYDEMLDYCIGKSPEFSTGKLKFSEEGKEHFDDVKRLFILDFEIAAISLVGLLLLSFTKPKANFIKHTPVTYAAASLISAAAVISIFAAIDFNAVFTVFHHVFFQGRENWMFDPASDEIILILPEVYFRNCAILIAAVMIILCLILYIINNIVENNT